MVRIPKYGPPTHPGEMLLEEFLKPLKITQSELAVKLGVSYPRVNELIHGKRGVTPDTALRLEKLFGMEAQFWLNLQLAWDLYHVIHSSTAKEIKKIKRFSFQTISMKDGTGNLKRRLCPMALTMLLFIWREERKEWSILMCSFCWYVE